MDNTIWIKQFEERQKQEIKLARLYAKEFNHGTTGHNALMIIAKMAEILDQHEQAYTNTKRN
jgi:hypothetical protein